METVGRFAPTPSGRLHLGNVLCALLSWLSAKKQGGRVLLRIEDLDTARCGGTLTEKLLDDLAFLGLNFDGGYEPESYQSRRTAVYEACFEKLRAAGLLYPCYCSRAQLHAATAPHAADGQAVYDGHCRRYLHGETPPAGKAPAWRLTVPDETVRFTDGLQGDYAENLKTACGDFLVRRADGVFAYQLAVVADDALTGVNEVVRGRDLLSSTPRQLYLYRLLHFTPPRFYHIPLLLDAHGNRLSKRDGALDMGALRERFSSPEPLIGLLALTLGLVDHYTPLTAEALLPRFDWSRIPRTDLCLADVPLF